MCRYGEYGDEFYLIVEGRVKIYTPKTLQLQLPEAYEALSNLLLGPKLEDLILYGKGVELNQKFEIPLANGTFAQVPGRESVIWDKHARILSEHCQNYRLAQSLLA